MTGDETNPADAERRTAACRGRRFTLWLAAAIIVIIVATTLLARFEFVSAGFHAPFAMALGVIFTALLGAGLMALSFYSSKAGFDDAARGMGEDDLVHHAPSPEDR
jgi:hypothetical protein